MSKDMSFGMEEASRQKFSRMRKNIILSWERCKKAGLMPQDLPIIKTISTFELDDLIRHNQNLIDIALPYMKEIKTAIPQKNSVVVLCNKDCVVFYKLGHAPELAKLGIDVQHIVREDNLGTNCLGMCIAINKPVTVFGNEHFLEVFKGLAGFAVPIHGLNGRVLGALGIYMKNDYATYSMLGMLTVAAKGIENQILLSSKYLEQEAMNRILTEFNHDIVNTASMLSHEVRNSLSTISAYVQLLRLERVLDYSRADKILMEVSRVNKLLDDFKSLTKPAQLNFMRHSLNELLRYAADIMLPKAQMENIHISLVMPEQHVFVKVDKDAMEQVFINLIENAIQAMKKGGVLTIRLSKKDQSNMALIEFEDTGVGIHEENLSEVFKIFYTTKKGGSGIGLTLCKNIIRNHNGNISVQSKVGEGTTFFVELPCVD
jgi:signal transduction histidine kinase